MDFAILPPQPVPKPTLVTSQGQRSMAIVSFNTSKACNQNFSSRCPMKYTTSVKGIRAHNMISHMPSAISTLRIQTILMIMLIIILIYGSNLTSSLIGKVAADHSHKWIHKETGEQETNLLSAWYNSADSHPRTWEAQFQSGIKTIALIAVREGVVQLGAMQKVIEDLSYVGMLRRKFSLIESIPGVLLPHPSSSAFPCKVDGYFTQEMWQHQSSMAPPLEYGPYCHDPFNEQPPMMMKITPSMSSLENLLSKLPSVVPPPFQQAPDYSELQQYQHHLMATAGRPLDLMGCSVGMVAKGEDEAGHDAQEKEGGECSSSMTSYHQQTFHYHQDLNNRPDNGF